MRRESGYKWRWRLMYSGCMTWCYGTHVGMMYIKIGVKLTCKDIYDCAVRRFMKKMGLIEMETGFGIPTPEIYRFKRKMGLSQ